MASAKMVAEYMRGFKDGLESALKEDCKDVIKQLCETISITIKDVVPYVIKQLEIKADLDAARWIPVSDKLPDDIGMVLITWVNHDPESYYSDIKDVPQTGAGHYFNGKWFWYSSVAEDCIAEYGSACGIDCMDDAIEVIAWMPMPKAYEPDESEVIGNG
jgi:hypothetical protein